MGGKKDRYFSNEFKRNAVQLVVEKEGAGVGIRNRWHSQLVISLPRILSGNKPYIPFG